MVVKLDLESAFDRVRHRFLLDVLHKFGFGPKFITWIKACISEPWIAPLVNGRATNFFKASRELRQGCPLSPLLFVLQASVLSFLLNKKQADQEIMGLNIARGVKSINHALFADDSLLLGAACLPLAKRFKEVVDVYCEDSRSILNKGKCHIFCQNATIRMIQAISNCFGFAASPLGHPSIILVSLSSKKEPSTETGCLCWKNSSLKFVLGDSTGSILQVRQC